MPNLSFAKHEFKEIDTLPDGIVVKTDYIDEQCSQKILAVITQQQQYTTHYGYELIGENESCDKLKELNDPEKKIPGVCQELIDKCIRDDLIKERPDQLSVHMCEPGQGIEPRIENSSAYDDYVIILNLTSSATLEFRQKSLKKLAKLHLTPNCLLVLKDKSRYEWSYSIPERKHDLVLHASGKIAAVARRKLICLTFRKVKSSEEPELTLPASDLEARLFEKSYVHTIYNEIADHFSQTRHSAWPGVAKFIDSMVPYSLMLDVGCGNGKYLNLRKDLFCVIFFFLKK